MKYIELRYALDVRLVRFRRTVKRFLPDWLIGKLRYRQISNSDDVIEIVSRAQPWMSPNVWNEIVEYYKCCESPVVVEFGTGASSLHHMNNLQDLPKAMYIGIENDPEWFWLVVTEILGRIKNNGSSLNVRFMDVETGSKDVDVEILWSNLLILLRLRTTLDGYLSAFDRNCDVVVVDGISRKECIRWILNADRLRIGGLLMLMEAGRGSVDWWEGKLYGDDDYTPEVATLISLGGILVTGNGVDNWPGNKRKSPKPTSYLCPMEACKLIMPEIDGRDVPI